MWDDNAVEMQALIVAYDQTRTYDEEDMALKLAGAKVSGKASQGDGSGGKA